MRKSLLLIVFLLTSPIAQAQNDTSSTILDLPDATQKAFWKKMLTGSGKKCDQVVRTMFQGGRIDNIWSVGCRDGNEYSVSIAPDPETPSTLLTCKQLKAVAVMVMATTKEGRKPGEIGCWIKLKD